MKILFLVPYPIEGPSNRFRVMQYLPFLAGEGIDYYIDSFWETRAYRILYRDGYFLRKVFYFMKGTFRRIVVLSRLSDFDKVFVHREAYPIGGAFIERFIAKRKPLIYDFDDSIFLPSCSRANSIMGMLKRPGKVRDILKQSHLVIAGNEFLRAYSSDFARNTVVIPTPIDTDAYMPIEESEGHYSDAGNRVVIGWIGTYTTNQYLLMLKEVFLRLIEKYGDRIEMRLVGCKSNFFDIQGITYRNWSLDNEIKELQGFDIGVMPISDDEWARGKCSFKIIQYMSVGAAVAASSVGMNREIVSDGVNGFLVSTGDEWFDKICRLVEDSLLRRRFVEKGRETVEERYSLRVMVPRFIEALKAAKYGLQ